MSTFRILAPAKINLFLHITGKRADGYHLLESLTAFTVFGDTIEIAPADTLSLAVEGPFAQELGTDHEHNLVMKAARALQAQAGIRSGARMTLYKNIPVGGGLGGGSSDAAAAIKGLAQCWGLSLTPAQLQSMALPLGSDVPVCIAGKASWMAGIGDELTPLSLYVGDAAAVLVHPRVPLLTADVYRRFSAAFARPVKSPAALRTLDTVVKYIEPLSNMLEAPAVALQPMIGEMLSALRQTEDCVLARMSGSGASCFGLYRDMSSAKKAVHQLRRQHPKWWIQETNMKEV